MRGSRDFQKHKRRNICSAGAGSISFSSFDWCLLRCEGHILSSYVHMCISLIPFLALMLFLINSALVFSEAKRKSQDNEMLSQALFACSVELSLWWMSELVIDAVCHLCTESLTGLITSFCTAAIVFLYGEIILPFAVCSQTHVLFLTMSWFEPGTFRYRGVWTHVEMLEEQSRFSTRLIINKSAQKLGYCV